MGFLSGLIGGGIGFLIGGPWGAAIGFAIAYDISTEGGIVTLYEENWIETQIADWLMPDLPKSPTYASNQIGNTIGEGLFEARCYGQCKIGGNKLRFNEPDDTDLRMIVAHCQGPVEGISEWYVNDIAWGDLNGSHTKTEYTGTWAQTADARFASRASAYRGTAYTAFTFAKNDKQIGYDPTITCVMQGLLCAPLAGGADAFTRNPAVILYDFYLNVEGRAAGELDLNSFKSLEALCDETPISALPRYRFDFNYDINMTINDAKKLLWQSFNGQVIMSQGKYKCVWDSAQMADGSGGLTAKTVSHAFTMDNIVKGSLTWNQPEPPNIVRIHFIDSENSYQKTSVEVRDENDIDINGEILYEETCYYITDPELARRRAKFKFNKLKYEDYHCKLTAFSGAGDLEVYDLCTVTHTLPGWTTKQFIVTSKSENQYGQPTFNLKAYYSGVYDDAQVGEQAGYESTLPNPYQVPAASTAISAAMTAVGTAYDFDAVRVSFTPPTTDPFYSYSEIYASNDDATYYYVGRDATGTFTFNALGVIYEPGDTCYIKIRSVSTMGVYEDLPGAADASVVITSTIRLGSFYAGTNDFWGGNAAIGNAATVIVIGNLDGTPKIALGATADDITFAGAQPGFIVTGDGDVRFGGATHGLKFDHATGLVSISDMVQVGTGTYIDIDGANARIRSSNYVSGMAGAGFTLEPDLLEVGNIAARGIIRTAVFQKDIISAVGGNVAIMPADVLATAMTAADACNLTIEGNETFAIGDFLRIKDDTDDEWFEITNAAGAPTYVVTRDMDAQYGADANPTWQKGATVVNYRQSGDGFVYITASEANAPYLSVITHAGDPWDNLTTHMRLGNLNGFLGYPADAYGIAIGSATNYLKYEPTNGLRIKGLVEIIGDSAIQNMLMNGGFEETDGTNAYYWESGTGISTETSGGDDSNNWLEVTKNNGNNSVEYQNPDGTIHYFEVNEGETYEYGGSVKSDGTCSWMIGLGICDKDLANFNWSTLTNTDAGWVTKSTTYTIPAGKKFMYLFIGAYTTNGVVGLDNVYLKRVDELAWSWTSASDRSVFDGGNLYVGSSILVGTGTTAGSIAINDATFGNSGIQLKWVDDGGWKAKFYAGDGANEYFQYVQGTGVSISTAQADAITIKSGGSISIEDGGNITLDDGGDIILIGDDADPATIIFDGTSYDVVIGFNAAGTEFGINPGTDNQIDLKIGYSFLGTANLWKNIYLKARDTITLDAQYASGNYALIRADVDTDVESSIDLYIRSQGLPMAIQFIENSGELAFKPVTNKTIDLGLDGEAWDDAYADDWNNEADFYFLDTYQDLQTILNIKPSGEIDARSGLPLIDDNTLPDWMLVKNKRNPDKTLYSPDNKPWISNRVMFSVLMGAIKELNQKIEDLS